MVPEKMLEHNSVSLSFLTRCAVFFDFDNTLTSFDVLDEIIERFAINDEWRALEKSWSKGRIGSLECLQGQLKSVRATEPALFAYLSTIKIDPYFPRLLKLLREHGVEPVILSDSFSCIIEYILRNNGITDMEICANILRFDGDTLVPSFPCVNHSCGRCAHCKKGNLTKRVRQDQLTMYIGDGRSDICPAQEAAIVFAKESLFKHFQKTHKNCIAIRDLSDVYHNIRGRLDAAKE